MALVSEPGRLPRDVLEAVAGSLRADLQETEELVDHPRGRVLDPESLRTARELIEAARAVIERPGERTVRELAAEANLCYATIVSVVDLVKSHTEVPRVPPPR